MVTRVTKYEDIDATASNYILIRSGYYRFVPGHLIAYLPLRLPS